MANVSSGIWHTFLLCVCVSVTVIVSLSDRGYTSAPLPPASAPAPWALSWAPGPGRLAPVSGSGYVRQVRSVRVVNFF